MAQRTLLQQTPCERVHSLLWVVLHHPALLRPVSFLDWLPRLVQSVSRALKSWQGPSQTLPQMLLRAELKMVAQLVGHYQLGRSAQRLFCTDIYCTLTYAELQNNPLEVKELNNKRIYFIHFVFFFFLFLLT